MTTDTLAPNLVEALKNSAKEILETMVFMTPSALEVEHTDRESYQGEVIGVLAFTGTRSGSFVMHTDEVLARTVAAKMLMMEPDELESFDETADAYGEVVNMICGNFKNAWVEAGNQMDLSVPHVVHNGSVKLRKASAGAMQSSIRVTLEDHVLDISVHFES